VKLRERPDKEHVECVQHPIGILCVWDSSSDDADREVLLKCVLSG
jgi:hypothetical protein